MANEKSKLTVFLCFRPGAMTGEPDGLHRNDPFDGIEIIGVEENMDDDDARYEREYFAPLRADNPGIKFLVETWDTTKVEVTPP